VHSYVRSIGVSEPAIERALSRASSPYHNRVAAGRRLLRYAAFLGMSEARRHARALLTRLRARKP
jgi:hypothetical protein